VACALHLLSALERLGEKEKLSAVLQNIGQ
jgi:hypothetical protein